MATKLCIECVHSRPDGRDADAAEFARCTRPEVAPPSLVTGKPTTMYCSVARSEFGPCHPHADYYEPREGNARWRAEQAVGVAVWLATVGAP